MNQNHPFIHSTATTYLTTHYPPQSVEQTYFNSQVPLQHLTQTSTSNFSHSKVFMATPKSEKRKQDVLMCDACGIEVNSQQMMDVHIKGQKHIKKMKLKTVTAMTTETTNESSTNKTEGTTSNSTSQEKGVLQQVNELAKFHKVTSKFDLIKESGPPHAKIFEVQLSLADEIYTGTGTSIKRAQQMAAEKALASTNLTKPDATPRTIQNNRSNRPADASIQQTHPVARLPQGPVPMRPRITPPRLMSKQISQPNKLQEFLLKRFDEINEDENVLKMLNLSFEEIERALKVVSDKLMLTCQTNNMPVAPQLPDDVKFNNDEEKNEDSSESYRMLKGSMKVSVASMNLHLKSDYLYCMVVVCANKPNLTLLTDIAQELDVALNTSAVSAIQLNSEVEQTTPITYKVETPMDQACLHVHCSRLPNHTIQIMLTSPVFRTENYVHLNEELREKLEEFNPDPLDMLDKDKCLIAAAEIRHSYWFTHRMLGNQTNLIVLRLLRDLQNQQTALSYLNLWCLILLVYKCQSEPVQSVSKLFRLIFTCLSSGLLLPEGFGPGLIDPCEKEIVDATDYLTIDERLFITNYAQAILRLIAFEHYEQLFTPGILSTDETDNQFE